MSDSDSFTSLMALVDSHLSKTNASRNVDSQTSKLTLPSLANETRSDTRFFLSPGQRLPLPTLSVSDSPIQEVLAKQLNNMLKAKEEKKLQDLKLSEQQKLSDDMEKLKMEDNEEYVIDLAQAVRENMILNDSHLVQKQKSTRSSFESLVEEFDMSNCDDDPEKMLSPEPLLPCVTDLSYILTRKIGFGKCSSFGKVLTARLKPVAAPYLTEKIHSDIKRFDFKTKSPCDLIKEKLRMPKQACTNNKTDIFSIFPDLEIATVPLS